MMSQFKHCSWSVGWQIPFKVHLHTCWHDSFHYYISDHWDVEEKRKGPRSDLCASPVVMGSGSDRCPLKLTNCDLLVGSLPGLPMYTKMDTRTSIHSLNMDSGTSSVS